MSSPHHRWQLAAADQSARDAALVDRAERYADELDTRDLRLTVAWLVFVSVTLIVALAVIATQAGTSPLLSTLDDQPACSAGQVRFAPLDPDTVRTLLIHGRSARMTS